MTLFQALHVLDLLVKSMFGIIICFGVHVGFFVQTSYSRFTVQLFFLASRRGGIVTACNTRHVIFVTTLYTGNRQDIDLNVANTPFVYLVVTLSSGDGAAPPPEGQHLSPRLSRTLYQGAGHRRLHREGRLHVGKHSGGRWLPSNRQGEMWCLPRDKPYR